MITFIRNLLKKLKPTSTESTDPELNRINNQSVYRKRLIFVNFATSVANIIAVYNITGSNISGTSKVFGVIGSFIATGIVKTAIKAETYQNI